MAEPNILVVDDSGFNRLLLKRRLAELGYPEPVMAENGRLGLEAIEAQRFDAVLLDLEMPELDGIGVLEALRGRADAPPVIVISALTEMTGVIRCIELGAEDYLPKSFDPPLLRARLAAVLEKKRLRDLAAERLAALEAELNSARAAQLSLVPQDVGRLGSGRVSVAAHMEPARQVGGDLFEVMRLDAAHLLFGVADVSGKGAPAGLTMARTVGLIRSAARIAIGRGEVPSPATLMEMANDDLSTDNPDMTFVTALLGVVNTETGQCRICVAGHEAPFIQAAGGPRAMSGFASNPAMGVMDGLTYREGELTLAPGETLVLFTDGVSEAESPEADFYGRERLSGAIAGAGDAAPGVLLTAILADMAGFTRDAPQADDVTLLALRFG
ncbi:fused response regulator/phosphatase [Rhodovarius crocodyli]|uniref:Fused response regulator/phosphatase n=1 Tax=Rhodovarius crocodyli TaxID=1979269 RepID=A0A437MGA3_9PROT|nr:fused response regulator/phosphatase [Rhodovarius crocodyli]RVT96659.1 fused response regulator/phosphatase [Rhodovarius crocodyli]